VSYKLALQINQLPNFLVVEVIRKVSDPVLTLVQKPQRPTFAGTMKFTEKRLENAESLANSIKINRKTNRPNGPCGEPTGQPTF
jgi:hypothetical protein